MLPFRGPPRVTRFRIDSRLACSYNRARRRPAGSAWPPPAGQRGFMSRLAPIAVSLFLAQALLVAAVRPASGETPADYPVANGHFYTQANGKAGEGGTGFAISDADDVPFWSEYQRMGGPDVLGYPISRRF